MNLLDVTAALWIVVTLVAIASGGWLAFTFSRVDDKIRRALEQRLARGEITMDEYRAKVAILQG